MMQSTMNIENSNRNSNSTKTVIVSAMFAAATLLSPNTYPPRGEDSRHLTTQDFTTTNSTKSNVRLILKSAAPLEQEKLLSSANETNRVLSAEQTITDYLSRHIIGKSSILSSLEDEVKQFASKPAGWKGSDSQAAIKSSVRDALTFIGTLQTADIRHYPIASLDADGTYIFSWWNDELVADLSIYGNGTYSFFAQNGDKTLSSDSEDVGHMSDDFQKLLSI